MSISEQVDALQARAAELKSSTDQAQSQWKSMQADAATKMQAVQDRIGRQRDQRDVKRAEREAEDAEADAADALDYADWVVAQAQLAVLDAIDARSWADARAAASP